jgi:hypothetical protein
MPSAFTALANISLSGTATSITFSSISGSYRDLYMVITIAGLGSGGIPLIKANNDGTANYSGTILRANGSTANGVNVNAYNYGTQTSLYVSNSGSNNTFFDVWMPDYATTDKHKNFMIRSNGADSGVEMNLSKWNSTSAITSLVLWFGSGQSFGIGTTVALYGVSA